MPSNLPTAQELIDAAIEQGAFKELLEQWIDYLAGLLGTDGKTSTARLILGLGGSGSDRWFTNRGVWSSGAIYQVDDFVSYNNNTYLCILQLGAGGAAPSADATHWADVAALDPRAQAVGQIAVSAAASAVNAANSAIEAGSGAAASQIAQAATEAARDVAITARDQALSVRGVYVTTDRALSRGVAGITLNNAGSAGTDGTFPLTFTGGGGARSAGYFVVSGGAVKAIVASVRGDSYTSAPTVGGFSASTGLTGAAATAVIAENTVDGDYFYVRQQYGDAVDFYKNMSGVAVYQNTQPFGAGVAEEQSRVLERSPYVAANYPIAPIVELGAIDLYNKNGLYLPNRRATQPVSANIFSLTTGVIHGITTGTATPLYANGPAGNLTAKRIQLTAASNQYYQFFNRVIPAGTYRYGFKLKSTPGAGTQSFRHGNQALPTTGPSVTEASFTQYTGTLTSDGTTAIWFLIIHDSVNLDALLDELQLYPTTAALPAFSTEKYDGHASSTLRWLGSLSRDGNAIKSATISDEGIVQLSQFPAKRTFSQATVFAMISTDVDTDFACKIFEFGASTGLFGVGISAGGLWSAQLYTYLETAGNKDLFIKNRGYHIVAARFKAGEQAFFFNEIKWKTTTATLSPFDSSNIGFFGDAFGITGHGAYKPASSKMTIGLVFDQWMDDTQVPAIMASMRARHALYGEAPTLPFDFWIAEGDSITFNSGGYYKVAFTTGMGRWFGKIMAVGGSTLATANTRLPATLVAIAACKALGGNPVVSILIGANAPMPSISDLITYWTAIRGAGAKIIAATLTPRGDVGSSAFNVARNALNTQIRASSAYYDALFDFAADATIGPDAAGADTSLYPDGLHPSATTWGIMGGIAGPVVETFTLH